MQSSCQEFDFCHQIIRSDPHSAATIKKAQGSESIYFFNSCTKRQNSGSEVISVRKKAPTKTSLEQKIYKIQKIIAFNEFLSQIFFFKAMFCRRL